MTTFYRVFPEARGVAEAEPGGPLYVPRGGANRIDNPSRYRTLNVAAEPEAAVAETFGRFPVWRPETFVHANGDPYALATLEAAHPRIFDLDDVASLGAIGISRPSDVVVRNRDRTQGWARVIHDRGDFDGISWWSYYDPAWTVFGFWNVGDFVTRGAPVRLLVTDPTVRRTASRIARHLVP